MDKHGYILGIGAANIDVMGRSRRVLVPEDSNPGHIELSVGGATHNACENAARLSVPVSLLTVTGEDHFGSIIRTACQKAGINTDHFITFPDCPSSSYMSVHNRDGEMNIAVSDMSILQKLTVEDLEKKRPLIEGASVITFDTGLPQQVIDYLLKEYSAKVPIFADTVSTTYAEKLVDNLSGIHTLKPNLLEAEVLWGHKIKRAEDLLTAADFILSRGVKRVFISLGKQGVFYRDAEGQTLYRRTRRLDRIANVTGAGDAFLGALLYAHVRGFSLEQTLETAMTVSVLTVQDERTISQSISRQSVEKSIPLYRDEQDYSITSITF